MAEFLAAREGRKRERAQGSELRYGSYGGTLRALRRSPGARLRRWPSANRAPLLHELGGAGTGAEEVTGLSFPSRSRHTQRVGSSRGVVRLAGLGLRLVGLAKIDATFEERAIFDAEAVSRDVASHRSFRADIHAISNRHVAAQLTHHNHFFGSDVG